jgi:hypothetical protein
VKLEVLGVESVEIGEFEGNVATQEIYARLLKANSAETRGVKK